VDSSTFEKLVPGPQDLIEAYDRYKAYVSFIRPKVSFLKYTKAKILDRLGETCETRMKSLKLCLEWGKVAL
ncbi:hypothetical protein ASPBRDRAFT_88295, partial [Aspergillus brasiliensis CBS 101740]